MCAKNVGKKKDSAANAKRVYSGAQRGLEVPVARASRAVGDPLETQIWKSHLQSDQRSIHFHFLTSLKNFHSSSTN